MQRHGWAFCLGMLALASAAAQPPADSERYPPAPNLPGIVVSQPTSTQPILDQKEPTATKEGDPKVETAPRVDATPPKHEPLSPPAACAPAGPVCKTSCCSGGCLGKIREWLTFKSRARQTGHYPSPYTPPLYAWFPCDPNHKQCAPAGPVKVPGWAPPGPMSLPKPGEIGPPPKEMPPMEPTAQPESDLLPGFKRVEVGLSFAPGGAPMAAPTTQTEKVSNWRPR
jgi:hypothetical protein